LGKEDPITEALIRELHKITVENVRGEKPILEITEEFKISS